MNKQQLASKIWASANKMRSKIEANEYKDYILGFIFYKFLSDKEVSFLKNDGMSPEEMPEVLVEENKEVVEYCQKNIGYFISYENLNSTWLDPKFDFSASRVTTALSAFSRLISKDYEKVFENIFQTLQTGLSKLGGTREVNDLLQLIKDIQTDDKQGYDVLGFIYEYLISNFAANAGKKAGEFYTPHEVALLMAEIVADHSKDKKELQIYDPTSGSGSLLINIGRAVSKYTKKDSIKYYAQELKENTFNLTRMNLVMRGIAPANIITRNADTLEDDWPLFDEKDKENTYVHLLVDAVVSNPPYSQAWSPDNKENDPRYNRFGLAPKGKADYAFLLHDLYHIKPDGIMTIVLPHGVLFRGGEEEQIRKNLVEYNHIDTIIGLPANIFFGTGIPTIIMVLKQKRENSDVLIIDASKGFEKVGKNNKLRACDIKRIADAVASRTSIPKFSKVVNREEIRKNGYNLNIPRYVDSNENAEKWDIYASMFGGIPNNEIDELSDFWDVFPTLKSDLFNQDGTPISSLKATDIQATIEQNADVKAFVSNYNKAFADIADYLKKQLVDNAENVEVSKEKEVLTADLFKRLDTIKLIDRYQAYQLLDNQWQTVDNDLEMIQSEGYGEATRRVDPNMVVKKKDGKDIEVQEGWCGHIIPFELAQANIMELRKMKESIDALVADADNRASEYAELFENIEADDKENISTEDGEIDLKEIAKKAKALAKEKTKYADDSFEAIVLKIQKLVDSEKALRKSAKQKEAELHLDTKSAIETLADYRIADLLQKKWNEPLSEELLALPTQLVAMLTEQVKALAEKYAVTYADLATESDKAEKELSAMISDLTGSDYDMRGLQEFQSTLKSE